MNELEGIVGNSTLVSDSYTFSLDKHTGGSMIMKKVRGKEIKPHFMLQAFTPKISSADMWEISNQVCDYFNNKEVSKIEE